MANKQLILCDFDGTLFRKDSFLLFIKFYSGRFKTIYSYLLFSPLIFLFYLKLYSGEELKKNIFSFHFKNFNRIDLENIGMDFCNKILLNNTLINRNLLQKLEKLKNTGAEVCIVSASIDVWIKPFAEKFKYNFLCTELEYIDSVYSGNFSTKNCNSNEKKVRVTQFYNLVLFDEILVFGNSKGDNEMAEIATKVEWIRGTK